MPPSSCLDRSMSWWISQTRWPPKSCVCVNMVFSDKASQRLCQGIRVLKGWAAVWAANYLYVNGTLPDSLFCVSAPAMCVSQHVCVCVRSRKEFRGKEGVFKMTWTAVILICSEEVFKLWKRCYYTLPQSCLCNVLFAMPGPDFADGN